MSTLCVSSQLFGVCGQFPLNLFSVGVLNNLLNLNPPPRLRSRRGLPNSSIPSEKRSRERLSIRPEAGLSVPRRAGPSRGGSVVQLRGWLREEEPGLFMWSYGRSRRGQPNWSSPSERSCASPSEKRARARLSLPPIGSLWQERFGLARRGQVRESFINASRVASLEGGSAG